MMSATENSKADYHLIEAVYGSGMYFQQAKNQVDVLHSVSPADHIPNLKLPMLFFNGSEDHRDSEDKWLSLCKDQELSSLKTYEGADHFFMHDSRFIKDMLDRMDKFAMSACKE